jgi:hypothetical protein
MNTLVHTTCRANDNAVRIARVAAAGRVQDARLARRAQAQAWVDELRAAGATVIGFKICDEMGKWRMRRTLEDAVDTLVSHWGGDVEAWGLNAEMEYVGSVW